MRRLAMPLALIAAGWAAGGTCRGAENDALRIPVLYSTDLFQPYDDPDDHFDLATLFGLPEPTSAGSFSTWVRSRSRKPAGRPSNK